MHPQDRATVLAEGQAVHDSMRQLLGRLDRCSGMVEGALRSYRGGDSAQGILDGMPQVNLGALLEDMDTLATRLRGLFARALLAEGATFGEVADALGVSRQRAWQFARWLFTAEELARFASARRDRRD